MEFKTFEIEEFQKMIAMAVREGLSFSANACGDELHRVYIIEYHGGY